MHTQTHSKGEKMPVDGWKVKILRQINNNVVKCWFDLEGIAGILQDFPTELQMVIVGLPCRVCNM
jgi:hypothetical protein